MQFYFSKSCKSSARVRPQQQQHIHILAGPATSWRADCPAFYDAAEVDVSKYHLQVSYARYHIILYNKYNAALSLFIYIDLNTLFYHLFYIVIDGCYIFLIIFTFLCFTSLK